MIQIALQNEPRRGGMLELVPNDTKGTKQNRCKLSLKRGLTAKKCQTHLDHGNKGMDLSAVRAQCNYLGVQLY